MAKKTKNKFAFGGDIEDPMQEYLLQQYLKSTNRPNHIENPNQTLAENDLRKASAMQKVANNPLYQGLDMAGSMAMQYGMNMMSSGSNQHTPDGEEGSTEGFAGFMNKLFGKTSAPKGVAGSGTTSSGDSFKLGADNWDSSKIFDLFQAEGSPIGGFAAFGGSVGSKNVEVEGEEVADIPGAGLMEFQGPSHEQGGIDTTLPTGTDIFSKRIKVGGKTMAERKTDREKFLDKLQKITEKNKYDLINKNTFKRSKQIKDAEEQEDLGIQEEISALYGNQEQAAYGKSGNPIIGSVIESLLPMLMGQEEDPNTIQLEGAVIGGKKSVATPTYVEDSAPVAKNKTTGATTGNKDENSWDWKESLLGADMPTLGDAMGIFGNLKQANDLNKLVLANRSGSTLNQNHFENFGKNSLNTIQSSKNILAENRDETLKDLNLARNTAVKRNRSGASSINTMRALDLATDSNLNNTTADVYNNYANQILNILGQESQLHNQIDQVVMQGEAQADIANRQDRDAFFNNLATAKKGQAQALSTTGKHLNQLKERKVNENFLNELSDYIKINTRDGKISTKDGVDITVDEVYGNKKEETKEETKVDVDKSIFNNYINPETGKIFASSKEWTDYEAKLKDNPYLDSPEEADTNYKNKIDPKTNRPFASKVMYDKFLETGKTAEDYTGQDLFSGDKFYKNLPKKDYDAAKKALGIFLQNNKMNSFNIDNKEDVKKIEEMLGLKKTGAFGKNVFEALLKANKNFKSE